MKKENCQFCFDKPVTETHMNKSGSDEILICESCWSQEIKHRQALQITELEEEIKKMKEDHEKERIYWFQRDQLLSRENKELKENKPTPKSLFEAISNGLEGQSKDVSVSMIMTLQETIQDFASQHFTKAMLEVKSDEALRLKALFDRIFKDKE